MHGENDRLFQSLVLSRQLTGQESDTVTDAANLVRTSITALICGKHLLGLLLQPQGNELPSPETKRKIQEFIRSFSTMPKCRSARGNVQLHDWRNGLTRLACYEIENIAHCRETLKCFLRQLELFSPSEFISDDNVQLIDLIHLINKQVHTIRNRFPNRSIALELAVETEPVLICQWPIIMCLHNLLFNADQASPSEARITVNLNTRALDCHELKSVWNGQQMSPGNYAALSVVDKGHGIPDEIKDRVFNEAVSTKQNGTGTGLKYLGETVARYHGGASIESSPRGTTVTMFLPFAPSRMPTTP